MGSYCTCNLMPAGKQCEFCLKKPFFDFEKRFFEEQKKKAELESKFKEKLMKAFEEINAKKIPTEEPLRYRANMSEKEFEEYLVKIINKDSKII